MTKVKRKRQEKVKDQDRKDKKIMSRTEKNKRSEKEQTDV